MGRGARTAAEWAGEKGYQALAPTGALGMKARRLASLEKHERGMPHEYNETFFYVMSLNWILTFVDKHITSGWSRKRKLITQLIILITGITLFKVLGVISQSWL